MEEAVEEVLYLVQKANEKVIIPKLEHQPSFKGIITGNIVFQKN